MQVIRWLAGNPASFPAAIDSSRIYLLGGSMGGSGVNHITCKQGDIITSGQASKGYTNWSLSEELAPYARDNRVNVFLGDFQRKFGTLDDNNTTNLSSKRVFDVLNLASWVSDPRPTLDIWKPRMGPSTVSFPSGAWRNSGTHLRLANTPIQQHGCR